MSTQDKSQEDEWLEQQAEREAMIDTIKELEKDCDALLQVARMSLQQFEFQYGKRKRGWDAQHLMDRLRETIAKVEGFDIEAVNCG